MSSKSYLFLTVILLGLNQFAFSAGISKEHRAKLSPTVKVMVQLSQPQGGNTVSGAAPSQVVANANVTHLNIVTPAKALNKPLVTVKGYKEWKNEKVQSAIKKVTITRAQIDYKKLNKQIFQKTEAGLGKDIEIEKLEAQLKNDLFSLEIVQQLGVQDYFAIYLTKLENKNDAYKEAAQKMNSEEITELINAFADSFVSSQGGGAMDSSMAPSASGESFEDRIK